MLGDMLTPRPSPVAPAALPPAAVAPILVAGLALALALTPASAGAQQADGGKAGPVMINLKLGPSFGISGSPDLQNQVALVLDAGFAVTRDRNAYIVFSPQFQLAGDVANVIMVPLGFQYDIAIRPVRGLYVYPRLSVGYAVGLPKNDFFGLIGPQHAFLLLPEIGVKYVLARRWNFGFEPFSLPIGIGCDFCTQVSYRLHFYAGVNF
jgi:hypothetical protein